MQSNGIKKQHLSNEVIVILSFLQEINVFVVCIVASGNWMYGRHTHEIDISLSHIDQL